MWGKWDSFGQATKSLSFDPTLAPYPQNAQSPATITKRAEIRVKLKLNRTRGSAERAHDDGEMMSGLRSDDRLVANWKRQS